MPGQAYDFIAPFFTATIVTTEGERVPLWVRPDRQTPTPTTSRITPADRPFVSSVTIKQNLGGIPQLSATLNPPYEEGLDFLDSSLAEWGSGAKLEVIWGYSQGPSGTPILSIPYVGLLLKPDVGIGSTISYTLNAHGVNANFLTTTSSQTLRGSRDVILRKLLEGFGDQPRKVKLDVTEVYQYGERDQVLAMFSDQLEVVTANRTDWQVFYELTWEIGCWLLLQNDVVKVVPRTLRLNAEPKYILSVRDFPGGSIGFGDRPAVLPITSISSPSLGVYLPTSVTEGFRQAGINTDTRKVETQIVNETLVAPARTGPGNPGPAADNTTPAATSTGQGADYLPGNPDDKETTTAAKAEYAAMTSQAGVKLEVSTLAVPDLFPGDVVRVVGAGRRLTQNYAVMDEEITVAGSATMKLTLVSNIDFVVGPARQQIGSVNRHAPDTSTVAQQSGTQSSATIRDSTPQPSTSSASSTGTAATRRAPTTSTSQGGSTPLRSPPVRPTR